MAPPLSTSWRTRKHSTCKYVTASPTLTQTMMAGFPMGEMLKELQCLRVFETHFGVDVETDPDELVRVYDSLFVQFDHDLNGTVDLEEFKSETKLMMLAMANGMGFLPVQMVLEEDSFLKKAAEWESAKLVA
ncbi:hypothetical protein OIU78_011206 [Salix suchowensis]|nr:hypothetical protein OIU78_011206 [Salix suchowensis]